MNVRGRAQRPRRGRATRALCRESVHLIGGTSPRPVAAILNEAPWGISCWYNRRLIYGPMLGWLDLWAQRQVTSGWRFKALRATDLPRELMN